MSREVIHWSMAQPGRKFSVENVGDHMLFHMEEQRGGGVYACVEPATFEQVLNPWFLKTLLDEMLTEMRK